MIVVLFFPSLLASSSCVKPDFWIRNGLLDRIEVLSLYVLDQGHLDALDLGELLHKDGNRLLSSKPGGPVAPLSRYDDIFAGTALLDEQRLDYPLFSDRVGKLLEAGLIEGLPWLVRIGLDVVESDMVDLVLGRSLHDRHDRFPRNLYRLHLDLLVMEPVLGLGLGALQFGEDVVGAVVVEVPQKGTHSLAKAAVALPANLA